VRSRNRLGTPFSFKQRFAPDPLDSCDFEFEPCSLLRVVGCSPIFCDNALEIQLASVLEQGNSTSFYVLGENDG